MDEEFKEVFGEIVNSIGEKLKNLSQLKVETYYIDIDAKGVPEGPAGKATFETSRKPLAKTFIEIDGDNTTVVPVRVDENGKVVVDKDLLDLHNTNLETARKYRTDLMNTFINLIRS